MPVYSYRCKVCDAEFDVIRPVGQRNKPTPCACGNLTRQRLFETFAMKVSASSAPQSSAQKLAGARVNVPAVRGATSVLGHACHSGCGCK